MKNKLKYSVIAIYLFLLFPILTVSQNSAPVFTSTTDTLTFSNEIFSYNISVTDADADFVTLSCPVKPAWANFSFTGNGEAVVWGTPGTWLTDQSLVIDATDGTATTTQNFEIDVHNKVSQQEFDALVAFYNATNGSSWNDNSGWNTTTNNVSSRWNGLSVSPDGKVIAMYLYENNLSGVIPPEIGQLNNIVDIDLHQNSIGGTLPAEIGQLSKLLYFQIFENNISGIIPPEIGNLTKVEKLVLSDNNFGGAIPTEIGQLTELVVLSLNDNSLSGDIPNDILNLTKLQNLSLAYNELTSIPDFTVLTNLEKLKVEQNRLFFEHLEPNMPILSNSTNSSYRPQKIITYPVGKTDRFVFNAGETVVLDVDFAGNYNRYQWFKEDGNAITARSSSSSFSYTNLQPSDAGRYYAYTTNTLVEFLGYNSEYITLVYNNPPDFTSEALTVAEEETLYSYNITVADADALDVISISCTDKPGWLTFNDLGNGNAVLSGTPLNQHVGNVQITINAVDGVVTTPTQQTYTLQIRNANDLPTDMSLSNNTIEENSPENKRIGMLSTTDPDVNDVFSYKIISGNTGSAFKISSNQLLVDGDIDYESITSYNLGIRSTDSGGESIEKNFIIHVIDIADPPTELNISNLLLTENIAAGSIVADLATVDQDDAVHTYSFTPAPGKLDDDNGRFYLNGNQIHIIHQSDYEQQKKYYVAIKTEDAAGNFLINTFVFEVENINDTPPEFDSEILSVSIDENTNITTSDFVQLHAHDPDTLNDIAYSIMGSSIAVVNKNGLLKLPLNHRFDYETTQQYAVNVVASDTKYTTILPFTFNIVDVNEVPDFETTSTLNELENSGKKSVFIDNINNGDAFENQLLSFNISVPANNLVSAVSIDYTQGRSTAKLNYSIGGNDGGIVLFDIELKDNGIPQKSVSKTITLNVQAVNTPPEIYIPIESFETYEGESLLINDISVTDPDVFNNKMQFRIAVNNGNIELNNADGLTFLKGGIRATTIECTGTLNDLNNAISQITYKPRFLFFGSDEINISVSDLGHSGVGGELTRSVSIPLNVKEILLPKVVQQPVSKNKCTGDNVVFSTDVEGYKLEYQWYFDAIPISGETNAVLAINNIEPKNAGKYSCRISNPKGIVTTNKVTLNVKSLDFDVNITHERCADAGEGEIQIRAFGGYGIYTYSMNENATSSTTTNLFAGIYTINVNDAYCSATKTAELNQPAAIEVEADITDLECYNEPAGRIDISATGGNGAFIYQLTNDNNYEQTLALSFFDKLYAGNYTLKTIDAKECETVQAFKIEQPAPMFASFTETPTVCFGGKVDELYAQIGGGSPPYKLSWTNYVQSYVSENVSDGVYTFETQSATFPAGIYRVTLTDQNGCEFSTSHTIENDSKIELQTEQITEEFCAGNNTGAIDVDATGGTGVYTFSMAGISNTTGLFENLSAGSYQITVTDSKKCNQTFDIQVTALHYPPVMNFEMEYIDSYGAVKFFNFSTNADSVLWDYGNGTHSGWLHPLYSPIYVYGLPGDYPVILTAKNICETRQLTQMLYLDFPLSTNNFTADQVQVFPNPASQRLIIQLPDIGCHTAIALYDANGKLVLHNAHTELYEVLFDVSHLKSGLYVLKVETQNVVITKKIMIN